MQQCRVTLETNRYLSQQEELETKYEHINIIERGKVMKELALEDIDSLTNEVFYTSDDEAVKEIIKAALIVSLNDNSVNPLLGRHIQGRFYLKTKKLYESEAETQILNERKTNEY